MGLRGWTWEAAGSPAGLGQRPLLEALGAALPDESIAAAMAATGTRERRQRLLPTRLVVTLVVALGLWAEASMRHALTEVVAGWRETARRGAVEWSLPSTPAIVQARQRAGARLFCVLFHAVAHPIATRETKGAFLGGLRLIAIDGTTLDVADTSANAHAFGRPGTQRGDGAGAFPQIRASALIETGTHVPCDVVLRPYRGGEGPAGLRLLRSVGPGMLLLWDRNFHAYKMIRATLARGTDFLGRAKGRLILEPTKVLRDGSFLARVYPTPHPRRQTVDSLTVRVIEYMLDTADAPGTERYRLVTSLLDEQAFPSQTLATAYPERWDIETTLDELKVHQGAHPRPLRSQHPREVVQEVYGLLLAHLAIRTLMHQAAVREGLDSDQLSFTGALRVLRRAIPQAQRTTPAGLPLFRSASSPTSRPAGGPPSVSSALAA